MNKPRVTAFVLLLFIFSQSASAGDTSWYRATFIRPDGVAIPFRLGELKSEATQHWVIQNAEERIVISDIRTKGDSVWLTMPAFESVISFHRCPDKLLGYWKRGAGDQQSFLDFEAIPAAIPVVSAADSHLKSGRWSVTFTMPDNRKRPAVALLNTDSQQVTGTILTPSGDYRYLSGFCRQDSLFLSTFDGSHAFYLTAQTDGRDQLKDGWFYSGAASPQRWEAVFNPAAALPDSVSVTPRVLRPEESLSFAFRDLDSNLVRFEDPRFKGKPVVIQLMGSWCPNCLDETAFLSDYYRDKKYPDLEMVALAYEASTNFPRSQKSLRKFQRLFDVPYPMLITGVTSGDPERAMKTLPILDKIAVFPTTIFVDRHGHIRSIHTGFYGPGSGEFHEAFKQEFEERVKEITEGR